MTPSEELLKQLNETILHHLHVIYAEESPAEPLEQTAAELIKLMRLDAALF